MSRRQADPEIEIEWFGDFFAEKVPARPIRTSSPTSTERHVGWYPVPQTEARGGDAPPCSLIETPSSPASQRGTPTRIEHHRDRGRLFAVRGEFGPEVATGACKSIWPRSMSMWAHSAVAAFVQE
jgi:hypothetical protein